MFSTDLRVALRQLTASPGFTAIVVLTLALGIGINTAIFSFFHGILLRPLPFDKPERIALLQQSSRTLGELQFTATEFHELRQRSDAFEKLAAYSARIATLTGRGSPDMIFRAVVSPEFFPSPGVNPQLGLAGASMPQDSSNSARTAVLSDRLWRGHFGRDATIVGQSVVLNGVSFTVAGVMLVDFEFPRWVDVWVTAAGSASSRESGGPVFQTFRARSLSQDVFCNARAFRGSIAP